MAIQLGVGAFNVITKSPNTTAKLKSYMPDTVSEPMALFSAQVEVRYGSYGDVTAFTVRFIHDGEPVYVRDLDLLGEEGAVCEDPAFRFFDWKNPVWTQISGTVVREKRTKIDKLQYTQAFTFTVGEDVVGIDYFGLRLKRGMFGFQCQDAGVCVVYRGIEQHMTFDTPYFILNPKDQARDLIRIRQDRWMPLLVSAYILGSAVERRGRPYFSQAIERICEWFPFMLGQMRNATDALDWDQAQAQRQLVGEMLRELWEKGPRRLVAFYSGMGYVFNALGLADIAADTIHDFHTDLGATDDTGHGNGVNDVSSSLFAVMLLLALRTEKARLYVTIDLNEQQAQLSYTQRGIRELIETKTLMDLYFATQGQRYAPIKIPKPFELHWEQMIRHPNNPQITTLIVHYKRDTTLQLAFALGIAKQRYSVSLVKVLNSGEQEWLGRIILSRHVETGQVHFIAESMTSNFRHLRNINAFKYILLVAAMGYSHHLLGAAPEQIIFDADFFDHCAPYDLMLLQQFGWEPVACELSTYNLAAAELFPYSGRAMTLPVVRIPSTHKSQAALVVYMLGKDRSTVAIDQAIYKEFIATLHKQIDWPIKTQDGGEVLVDGLPHHLASLKKFHQAFATLFPTPSPFEAVPS